MDLPARHAALGLVVATLLAGPACVGPAPGVGAAPPRGDRPSGWIEVSSAHVGIVSALDESATLEIAARLEIFRRAVAFLTNLGDAEARVPTRFHLFRDRTRFVELVRETAGGFFLPRMRHNLAALDASGANPTLNVLYHEYAHFLISGGTRPLPIWFEEGAAGLLESFRVEDDAVVFGASPPYRVRQLAQRPWIPMRNVITGEGLHGRPSEVAMFYAQSWALVHYLLLGPEAAAYPARMRAYLSALEEGERPVEAFEAAFDLKVSALPRRLVNYLRQGKRVLRIQRSALRGEGPAELALRTRSVSQAELAEGLGVLATELGKVELAHFYLDRALEADPFLARARAGMGRVLELQERWEEAEVQHGYAVELDPGDALNHLDAGRFWHGRAASNDDVRQRQAWLEQARAHYERSLQLDPACPETWAGLGSLILDARTSPERGVELLEHAHALLPGNFEIALRLGTAYVDARRYTEARQTLEPLVVHDLAPADARRIQTLLTTIAGAGA